MRPTVRSRLWAAGTAFVAGFVIANVGILLITGRTAGCGSPPPWC